MPAWSRTRRRLLQALVLVVPGSNGAAAIPDPGLRAGAGVATFPDPGLRAGAAAMTRDPGLRARAAAAMTPDPGLSIVVGVTEAGDATEQWLAMIRTRLPEAEYRALAPMRKPLTRGERAWAELIRSRATMWAGEIPALADIFQPVGPPARALIVLGNRGGEDAFTHDPTTIGFDLSVLQSNYGEAGLPENTDRMDRFFRHEYAHLLQKAWLQEHPFVMDSPLRTALAEIWTEGLGNYYSMSFRWRAEDGRHSEAGAEALAALEPRFAARLSALACTSAERAADLTADLSNGRFHQKWGALTTALWLEAEASRSERALREFVLAGPDGVWTIAGRHLPVPLRAVVEEGRLAAAVCADR